ncbi:MAG: hypothetical protein JWM11_6127 [Planctomycetaceae bacterium]|nr:hypothetical protein [Planctomycetaceae bacterium]
MIRKDIGTIAIISTSTIDESAILARVIAPHEPNLPPGVAAEFLKWSFDESDKQRMSELAEKARRGALTPDEQAETESFERVSSFLGVIKSKARRSLQSHASQ